MHAEGNSSSRTKNRFRCFCATIWKPKDTPSRPCCAATRRKSAAGTQPDSIAAGLDAAGPVRHRAVPPPARPARDRAPADHHADRARRGSERIRGLRPARTIMSSSRSRARTDGAGPGDAAPGEPGGRVQPCCGPAISSSTAKPTGSAAAPRDPAGADGVPPAGIPDEFAGPGLSREQLLDGVWGHDVYVDERTVDVHVGRLRKALNKSGNARPDPHRARRRLCLQRPVRCRSLIPGRFLAATHPGSKTKKARRFGGLRFGRASGRSRSGGVSPSQHWFWFCAPGGR
jgi:hypothetical protein